MHANPDNDAPQFVLEVRRAAYFPVALALLATVGMLLRAEDRALDEAPLLWVAIFFLAIPGCLSLRRLLGIGRFTLTEDAVMAGRTVLRFEDIAGVRSSLAFRARAKRGAIAISAPSGVLSIPRWTKTPSREFYDQLVFRLLAAQAGQHLGDSNSKSWAQYADAPAELRERLVSGACLFRGGFPKYLRGGRWLLPIGLLLLVSGCVLVASSDLGEMTAAGLTLLAGATLTAVGADLRRRNTGRREWLTIDPLGLAIVGKKLTGELSWEEVTEIEVRSQPATGRSREGMTLPFVLLTTWDAAEIRLYDSYDAPLQIVEQLCRTAWQARAEAAAEPEPALV